MTTIEPTLKGISFCHVAGPEQSLQPSGHPIFLQSPPFALAEKSPEQAIAERARDLHGIEIHLPHWELVSTFVNTASQQRTRSGFDYAFVLRYLPEEWLRARAGLSEDKLDAPLAASWYLARVVPTT